MGTSPSSSISHIFTRPSPRNTLASSSSSGVGFSEPFRSAPVFSREEDWSDESSESNDTDDSDILQERRTIEEEQRLQWQSMLSSVLHGDVFRGEKRRIIVNLQGTKPEDAQTQIWLGLRARLHGCTVEEELKDLSMKRLELADSAINRVLNFRVEQSSPNMNDAKSQADAILSALLLAKSLYPHTTAFYYHHPIAFESDFQDRRDALYAWTNNTTALNRQNTLLREWMGDEAFSCLQTLSSPSSDMIAPLRDRLLKDESALNIFHHTYLSTVPQLVQQIRDAQIDYFTAFNNMGLPRLEHELVPLLRFPLRMAVSLLSVQSNHIDHISPSELLSIEELTRQLQVALGFACAIKSECITLSRPSPGRWQIPQLVDNEFDSTVLAASQTLIDLTRRKIRRLRNDWFFLETEVLEDHLPLASDISQYIDGGASFITRAMCTITEESITYASHHLKKHLQAPFLRRTGPEENYREFQGGMTDKQQTQWYRKLLDSTRHRSRKSVAFISRLVVAISDASDFDIPSTLCQQVADRLSQSDHFILELSSWESQPHHILVSAALRDDLDLVLQILAGERRIQDWPQTQASVNLFDDLVDDAYILLWAPASTIIWRGDRIRLDSGLPPIELRTDRARLVGHGTGRLLQRAKTRFLSIVDPISLSDVVVDAPVVTCLVDRRAYIKSVNKQIRRLAYATSELAQSVVDCAIRIWEQFRETNSAFLLVEDWFYTASQEAQSARKNAHLSSMPQVDALISKLALTWVTFVAVDCDPTNKYTFAWALRALEFVKQLGPNLLSIPSEDFQELRSKVGSCMSLLISHYDVLGASQLQLRTARDAMMRADQLNSSEAPFSQLSTDNAHERRLHAISSVEDARSRVAHDERLIGRVLDRNQATDRSLALLASSASNIAIRWEQGRLVGEGTFGAVYLAVDMESGAVMAVKEIRFQATAANPELHARLKNEINVLEMISHPNIVQYYGIEVHRDKIFLFQEYLGGGSLENLLREGPVDQEISQMYAMQMLEGLGYLHDNGIIHRDIKPANLLLSSEGMLKFVDFGAAAVNTGKVASRGDTAQRSTEADFVGTPMYLAPEVVKHEKGGLFGARDVWAVGCVILELITGRKPWVGFDNEWAIMFHIAVTRDPPQLPEPTDDSLAMVDFVQKCLTLDATRRPAAHDLLEHEWMRACRSMLAQYAAIDTSEMPLADSGILSV